MGILNLTPDSFSGDGTLDKGLEEQLRRVDALIAAGADVIDVGAESTRPGAQMLTASEEWERLSPLVEALGERVQQVAFSIDTYHPENAVKAVAAGFTIVNDVKGSEAMMHAVAGTGATLIIMHALTVPADPARTLAQDADPVAELLAWGERITAQAQAAGIAAGRLVLDVGIGFGKTAQQSWSLLRHIDVFKQFNLPLLVGHSRKSFLVSLLGDKAAPRDAATLALSMWLAQKKVDYLRVHEVQAHRDMLNVLEAMI